MRPLALRTILVATDLTQQNESAVHTASELARLSGSRLHVVRALENSEPVSAGDVEAHVRGVIGDSDLEIEVVVMRGPPGAVVGQEARRIGADVVVLGPHRHREQRALGSTADRVVRTSATPCLILPERLRLPLRHVLAPVDSSAGARGALAVALTWASALRDRRHGTRVTALHIAPELMESEDDHDHASDVAALEAEVESIRTGLAGVAHVDVESVVLHNASEGQRIVRYAEEAGVDLIVIGTRGRSMTQAAILGSTSSEVVREASGPVLLVPPEKWIGET